MIEDEGNRYQLVKELTSEQGSPIIPLYDDMKNLPGIKNIQISRDGIFGPWGLAVPTKGENGQDVMVSVYLYEETMNFLNLYNIQLLNPKRSSALLNTTTLPVLGK